MVKFVINQKSLKKAIKIASSILLGLLIFIVILYGLLQTSLVQNWIVKKACQKISSELKTSISVNEFHFSFFNHLQLKKLLIKDQTNDTLAFIDNANIELNNWFFLHDTILIKKIALQNIIIQPNRKDSLWNYAFISNYFDDAPSTQSNNKKKKIIQFTNIEISNAIINQKDEWTGEDFYLSFNDLNVELNKSDFEKNEISINKINIWSPIFKRKDYVGRKIYSAQVSIPKKSTPNHWKIGANNIWIKNGQFINKIESDRISNPGEFDENNIDFMSINSEIHHLVLQGDTLKANLQLQSKERSGFEIKKLFANFTLTPQIMEFDHLDAETNKSHLKNYYSMSYTSFQQDMNRFNSNVILNAQLIDSKINLSDIGYFAPLLKKSNQIIHLSALAKGSVNQLNVTDFLVGYKNSFISGSAFLHDITDLKKYSIAVHSKASKIKYSDIVDDFPSIASINQPRLKNIGTLSFIGELSASHQSFICQGRIGSDLGEITTKTEIENSVNKEQKYTCRLETKNFQLGTFLGSTALGKIAFEGTLTGGGLQSKNVQSHFTGHISSLVANGYNYQNMNLGGNIDKNSFSGHFNIDDPNIKIKYLDGSVSFQEEKMNLNVTSELTKANLESLHFANRPVSIAGLLDLKFSGNTIDDFLGTAKIYNAKVNDKNKYLNLDSIVLSSFIEDKKKFISLKSNDLDAHISGIFKIKELPDAFKLFLTNYYPNYISKPTYALNNQDFEFSIRTKNTSDFFRILDPKIIGTDNANIEGSLRLNANEINLSADIPSIGYDNKLLSNVNIIQKGNLDSLLTNITISNTELTENNQIPFTSINIKSKSNVSDFSIKTSTTENINTAELNASILSLADGMKIHFSPSSFIINNKKWALEKDGELILRKNLIHANEIKFYQDSQSVIISSELDNISDEQRLIAQLNNFTLEDFIPFAFKDPALGGKLTGTAIVKDPLGKLNIEFNGNVANMQLDNKDIGNVSFKSNINTSLGMIKYEAGNIDSSNLFSLIGQYNYKDTSQQLETQLDGKTIQLTILEPYLKDIFSKLDGVATTKLSLSGNINHLYLTGKAHINKATCVVDFTKCKYTIENQDIDFEKDLIKLDFVQLKDTINNTATIQGAIRHQMFDELYFDNLKIETGKLALLHTNKTNNPLFYGDVTGKATLLISGPMNNTLIDIEGEPSLIDTSHIYISSSDSKESKKIDYIEFVQFGKEMEYIKNSGKSNLSFNLNVKANPSCKVDLILDEETGDIIKGQGEGLLNIKVGSNEPLSMRGNYKLTKGEYNFNFQTFFQKPFTLNTGNITWNGDPYQANIDIYAEYLAKNVDISSLSSNNGFQKKEDIKIISHLTGVLQNPSVQFDLELPEKSDAKREDIIVKRLADFKNDENEMNKQVASLLLFNTFIIGNQNFLTQGNTSNLLTNTIGGVVSSLLTNLLNKELEKATKGLVSTYIDINPTLDLQKSASQIQANIRAGLKISLSDKLQMIVGGNLDYNNPSYTQQFEKKGMITPDITIEWIINKDGTLRIVGFNKSSIDLNTNQRNKSGLQLSYRKNANKLKDAFFKKSN